MLRYKRDIGSRYTVGALVTDREGGDYFNRLAGLDLDLRVTQSDQIQLQLLGTSTAYSGETAAAFGQPEGTLNDAFVAFEWDHATRTHYIWLDYDEVGENFRADLGFIPMVDYRNVEGGYFYTWIAEQTGWWNQFRLGGEFAHYEKRSGEMLQRGIDFWGSYSGAMQSYMALEVWSGEQAYSGAVFDLTRFSGSVHMRPLGNLAFGVSGAYGDHIDYANVRKGKRLYLSPWTNVSLGKHLSLALSHAYEQLDIGSERLYTANISYLSLVYQVSRRIFLRSIAQYVRYRRTIELYISHLPDRSRVREFRHAAPLLLQNQRADHAVCGIQRQPSRQSGYRSDAERPDLLHEDRVRAEHMNVAERSDE